MFIRYGFWVKISTEWGGERSLKTDKWWRPITLYALKLWENDLFERSIAPRWKDFMTSKSTIKPNDFIKRKMGKMWYRKEYLI